MKIRTVVITIALCYSAAFAQTAKVVELSKEDATRSRLAYEAKQKADAEWSAIQQKIQEKYVSDRVQVSGAFTTAGSSITSIGHMVVQEATTELNPCRGSVGNEEVDLSDTIACIAYQRAKAQREAKTAKQYVYQPKDGWRGGFEFSEGFRFITPKPIITPKPSPWWGSSNVVTTPYVITQ